MLPNRVQLSLVIAQVLAAATLLRSIAYERWVTVLAALLLIAGTLAAQRGRTWGVALSFAVAVWFPMAFFVGIAPAWFVLVGLAAAWPFAQLWRSFARFDRGATTVLAGVAGAFGIAGALTWKGIAWPLFNLFPWLMPSAYAQNGLAVLATLGVMIAVVAGRRRLVPESAPVHARIAERVRFADTSDAAYDAEEAATEEQRSKSGRRA